MAAEETEKKIRLFDYSFITYDDAVESESNILCQHQQWNGTLALKVRLYQSASTLEGLVAFHLGVDAARVKMGAHTEWLQGGFNVVIPMLVFDTQQSEPDRRVVLRCPIPSRCAEAVYPGTVTEKMRCEAASYIYMQRHCPEVRIPHLYGFGFPEGTHFVHARRISVFRRALLLVRQCVASLLRRPMPSSYLSARPPSLPVPIESGYMVLEHLGPSVGRMVPLVVPRPQPLTVDPAKLRTFCRSLSKIMLSLARIPQPRIGAFRFNPDDGTIALDNRPIFSEMVLLENEGAPRVIGVDTTYASADRYLADVFRFHEQRFRAAPNAATDREDCEVQMSVMAFLHAVAHHFPSRPAPLGPFVLRFTDLNDCNFLIDDGWNITGVLDLEWIVAGPVDMLDCPHGLTRRDIAAIATDGTGYNEYAEARAVFMEAFRIEEERLASGATDPSRWWNRGSSEKASYELLSLSDAMDDSWVSERVWFYGAMQSLNGLNHLVQERLRTVFGFGDLIGDEFLRLWSPDAKDIVDKKMNDRECYVTELGRLFGRDLISNGEVPSITETNRP